MDFFCEHCQKELNYYDDNDVCECCSGFICKSCFFTEDCPFELDDYTEDLDD